MCGFLYLFFLKSLSLINEAAMMMMRRMRTKMQGNGRVAGEEENASDRKEEHLFGSGSPFPAWWYSAHTMYSSLDNRPELKFWSGYQ